MKTVDPDEFDNRPAHRRVGTYLVGIVVVGIAASVMVFMVAMQGMGWPPALLGSARPNVVATELSSVSFYISPQSRAYFASVGGNYDTLLSPWRKYFSEEKVKAKELSSALDIAALKPSILVLPSAVALGDDERRELLAFRDRGGSILMTWATGARSAAGEWVGGDFFTRLGNVVFSGEISKQADAGHLVLAGDTPVTFSEGAGKRIWLGDTAERPLRFKSLNAGARFLNSARTPHSERMDEAAIAYHEAGTAGGRVLVFGFAESAWEQQPNDLHKLVKDGLSWLSHRPTLVLATWPFARQSAQLIEMDTAQGVDNAARLLTLLKASAHPAAFYVLASTATEFPEVLTNLSKEAEIGYHGDTLVSFKDQAADVQSQRIAAMQSQMQSVWQDTSGLKGFRAPAEGYDKTTEQLLQKAGIRHHVSGPTEADTCLPAFAPLEGTRVSDGLLRLPRTRRDDLDLLKAFNHPSNLAQGLINDFELSRSLACLGILSVHSQTMAADQLIAQAMPAYLAHVQKNASNIWLSTPKAIDAWWRARDRLRLTVRAEGTRFEFDVSVGGDTAVDGGTLILMLPKKGVLPSISGVKPGMPLPKVVLIDDFRASLVFDSLKPGNYFYQATF